MANSVTPQGVEHKCVLCRKPLTSQEQATYGGRCEDCWSAGNDERFGGKTLIIGPASDYSCKPVGDLKRITNQLPRRLWCH